MSPGRHRQVRALFDEAVDLPPGERAGHIRAACGGDEPLRLTVESLLRQDGRTGNPLNSPAIDARIDPRAMIDFGGSSAANPHAPFDLQTANAPFPKQIAGFEILDVLGAGGMGIVFRAVQKDPRRIVALKTIRAGTGMRHARERFRAEADILARFQHSYIAQIYEAGVAVGELGDAPYIAMELVAGRPLLEVADEHRLGVRERLKLLARVAEAIAYAHQRGVIHRDLKPANILVAEGPTGNLAPKVVDFGIARLLDGDGHCRPAATRAGELLGTVAYMSPEQLQGRTDDVDTRTDVFALGLILFELLAGRPAYDTKSASGSRLRVRNESQAPPRLGRIRGDLRGDLEVIVAKATAIDKDRRYASVSDLLADIELHLSGMPIRARRPGFVYVASKFVRRHRLAVLGAGAVLAAGGFAGASVLDARNQRLDLAIQLASAWLDEALRMQRTAGESSKRGPLVARLAAQVDELAAIAPDDPRVQAMRASTLTERGYVAMERTEFDAALGFFDQALEIRRELAKRTPHDVDAALELSLAIVRTGDAAGGLGDSDARERRYREALRIQEDLADGRFDARVQSSLGWSYERLVALIPPDGPNRAERVEMLEKQAAAFESLGADISVDQGRGLSTAYANLSWMAIALGDSAAAAEYSCLALRHAEQSVARAPGDRHAIRTLIRVELLHRRTFGAPSDDATLARAEEIVHRAEELFRLDPEDWESRYSLVFTLQEAFVSARLAGQRARAVQFGERALQHLESLAERFSTDLYAEECRDAMRASLAELAREAD